MVPAQSEPEPPVSAEVEKRDPELERQAYVEKIALEVVRAISPELSKQLNDEMNKRVDEIRKDITASFEVQTTSIMKAVEERISKIPVYQSPPTASSTSVHPAAGLLGSIPPELLQLGRQIFERIIATQSSGMAGQIVINIPEIVQKRVSQKVSKTVYDALDQLFPGTESVEALPPPQAVHS